MSLGGISAPIKNISSPRSHKSCLSPSHAPPPITLCLIKTDSPATCSDAPPVPLPPNRKKKDVAFLLTVGSFLFKVELFYLQLIILAFLLTIGVFLLTDGVFFAYSWSFVAYSGRLRLIRALSDCKQRSLTVSKKAPTVTKKASPPQKKSQCPLRSEGAQALFSLSLSLTQCTTASQPQSLAIFQGDCKGGCKKTP